MINHYDIAYGLGLGISSPFWLTRRSTRTKVLRAFSQRMGHVRARDTSRPAIMIHAVSLGEINATRALIERLRAARADIAFIVSVTTETGYARGLELYGSAADVTLVRYPLDFSPAVDRLLVALRPALVVLMELEVWPNFIRRCAQRKIPVLLINGRITPGSFRKYRLAQPLVGSMFARLNHAAVQDDTYARRFVELGVPETRVSVTGTMKFDSATVADSLPGQMELAEAVRLAPGKNRIWVCGSTGPAEEALIVPIYRRLIEKFADLRLVIVPRKPERFDEAAKVIMDAGFPIIRRSRSVEMPAKAELAPIILGDTIGELRKFYALAEVVFVGRTLVDLGHRQHGSDMIEPAALGKPVVVGPFTANFADAMDRFTAADAMTVVHNPQELESAVEKMLANSTEAQHMGERARDVVKAGQGATQRNAAIILDTLGAVSTMDRR
jgi:3-deoxy-D-manno-octulosonic-acid transferase